VSLSLVSGKTAQTASAPNAID